MQPHAIDIDERASPRAVLDYFYGRVATALAAREALVRRRNRRRRTDFH
jgi:hypothetical protein